MKQITESYVSFETAKLLKEKGFDEHCGTAYTTTEGFPIRVMGSTYSLERNSDYDNFHYSMPSQSLALKWLREVHNIHISINVGCDVDNKNYIFYIPTIVKLNNKSVEYIDPFCEDEDEFDSNEQAVEAVILYVLKNLI